MFENVKELDYSLETNREKQNLSRNLKKTLPRKHVRGASASFRDRAKKHNFIHFRIKLPQSFRTASAHVCFCMFS